MLALAFTTVMLSGFAAVPPTAPTPTATAPTALPPSTLPPSTLPPRGRSAHPAPSAVAPKAPLADPLASAEAALRQTSNALLAKRRSAQMRHDRKGAQCYNQAIVRSGATLNAAHETWRRAQALRRIGGTSKQHARIRDDAVDALRSADARVARTTREADICAGAKVAAPKTARPTPRRQPTALLPPSATVDPNKTPGTASTAIPFVPVPPPSIVGSSPTGK